MPYYQEMKKMMYISNPLLQDVFMTRKCQVNLDETHTLVSELDALELQLFKEYQGFINKLGGVPLKIQLGKNTAFITAYITGNETIIGRLALDELSDRL